MFFTAIENSMNGAWSYQIDVNQVLLLKRNEQLYRVRSKTELLFY